MTSQTSRTVVYISTYIFVFVIGLRVGVARQTSENRIIVGIGMTICAGCPFPLMFATVYREVQAIVVKCCRCPVVFIVTRCAISWEVGSYVIGIGGSLVFTIVAAITSIRCIGIITIVAFCTIIGNGSMGSI